MSSKLRMAVLAGLLLLLAGCGTDDSGYTASQQSQIATSEIQASQAPDEQSTIRARVAGPVMGVSQRSTASDGSVVFHSETALLSADTNSFEDIYLRDGGELTLITKAPNGTKADNSSLFPCISADGTKVVFCSRASNLVPRDTNNDWDVFLYDRATSQISRISVDSAGAQGTHRSVLPSISADGTRVAFLSRSRFGTQKADNTYDDVFLRDLAAGTTTLVSRNGGTPANFHSYDPVISGDGSKVAYASRASNLVAGDTNSRQDIFVYDVATGINTNATAGGNSHSYWPSLSNDGSVLAFSSYANNLAAGDSGAVRDIFVRNNGNTVRVGAGNADAQQVAVSDNGQTIAFASDANNLVSGDTNGKTDIFTCPAAGGTVTRVSIPTTFESQPGDSDLPGWGWGGAYVSFRTQGGNYHSSVATVADKIVRRRMSDQTNFVASVTVPLCDFPEVWPGLDLRQVATTGAGPYSVALGDLNGDGRPDAVAACPGQDKVSVHLGASGGGIGAGTDVAVGDAPVYVALGDLNADGKLDLATANTGGTISVRLGNGAGGFTGTTELSGGATPWGLALGDVNEDGKLDIALANINGGNVSIRLGNASGGFDQRPDVTVGGGPACVRLGDINKDGHLDLVVANHTSDSVSIRFGNGAGGFSGGSEILVGDDPYSFALGDVNRDGNLDIIAANYSQGSVSVRLGDGSGGFSTVADSNVTGAPFSISVADLNGDGKLDLLTANTNNASGASLLIGNGQGGFSATTSSLSASGSRSLAVADADNDGDLDVVVANTTDNALRLFLNQASPDSYQGVLLPTTLERVSLRSDGSQGNGLSQAPSVSADGRYVVFQSNSSNLVDGDSNGTWDIFVRDRITNVTTLVSRHNNGTIGNGTSDRPTVSADGRYVAFRSAASNLVDADGNGTFDIFVHDRLTSITSLVSRSSGGSQGNGFSSEPSISSDGRYVTFHSQATNLVDGDNNSSMDIFVHDRTAGATTLISRHSTGTLGNSSSMSPAITPDGRYITFISYASNLIDGDTDGSSRQDIFVHDRNTNTTSLVSRHTSGAQGNLDSVSPSISSDGRYVSFQSYASNLVDGDTNGYPDIFVHDRNTGSTTLISKRANGAQGSGPSYEPSISSNGRYVAFSSSASNLVDGDISSFNDIFVHDRVNGTNALINRHANGAQADWGSYEPSISPDGRYVTFFTSASNLVDGDTNGLSDVFVALNSLFMP